MRFYRVGLDILSLLVVVFLFFNAFLLFGVTEKLNIFFSFDNKYGAILGCISLILAVLFLWFFIRVHSKKLLVVRFEPKQVDIQSCIIRDYLNECLKKIGILSKDVAVEIDACQKLHIHLNVIKFPEAGSLAHMEKEIGAFLFSKLGYAKDFQVYFSKIEN